MPYILVARFAVAAALILALSGCVSGAQAQSGAARIAAPAPSAPAERRSRISPAPAAAARPSQDYDFTDHSAELSCVLPHAGVDSSIMQSLVVDEKTGDIFVTQVTGTTLGSSESFRLIRYSPGGVQLDNMVLQHGGHGVSIALEDVGTDVYIWSRYDTVDASGAKTGNDLVRFRYAAGRSYDEANPNLTHFPHFGAFDFHVFGDQKNGTLGLWDFSDISTNRVVVYSLADLKNGVNDPIYEMSFPAAEVVGAFSWMQGVSLDGHLLYWLVGDNGSAVQHSVAEYDLDDDSLVQRIPTDLGYAPDGAIEGGVREPEGLYLYTAPDGSKSLLVAIVTAYSNWKVYGYHSGSNLERFCRAPGLLSPIDPPQRSRTSRSDPSVRISARLFRDFTNSVKLL